MKNSLRLLVLIMYQLAIPSLSRAQWTQTSLDSGSVSTLAVHGTNLFVSIVGRGVLRSSNSGTNWTEANGGLTSTTVVALAPSGTNLFAGTYSGGVFLSTDNGFTWTGAGSGQTYPDIYALAVSPDGAGGFHIFAATASGAGYGVFLSTNNGANWIDVSNGLTTSCVSSSCWVDAFAVYPNGAGDTMLFAGTVGRGIFVSTNNGANWNEVDAGLGNAVIKAFAISGTHLFAGTWGDGVFLLNVGGTSWTAIDSGLTNSRVWSLTVSGTSIFAGTEAGLFLSTNTGVNWTRVDSGLVNPWVTALAVSGEYLFAGTAGGTFGGGGGVWRRPLSQMITGIENTNRHIPQGYELNQNYPNPFNPTTNISFGLPSRSFVTLRVIDIMGREVAVLVSQELSAGIYSREWNAKDLPSGLYFYRLQAGWFSKTKKLILLR